MDKEQILAVRVGKALRRLREARGLKPAQLARESHIDPSLISRYEAGELCPTRVVLQAMLEKLNSDVTNFLARLGLTPEEYDTIRSRKYLDQGMLTGLREAHTVNEINGWLVEEIVTPRRGKRQALPDLDKLGTNLSRQFTSVRAAALTYPNHPFPCNANVVQPDDDSHLNLQLHFLQSLTRSYFDDGLRFTGVKAVPQKLWPLVIWENLIKPIIDSGDEKAPLATSILKNYEETYTAFHDQMRGQWQYLDIVPLSAIREVVLTGKPSPDSSLNYLGITSLCPGMVRDLLFSVMGLLHPYKDTYHLALLDDVSDPIDKAVQLLAQHITQHFWTVMPGADGRLSLIVTEWPVDERGQQREVHRHIDDMNIIKPFMEPFCELWRKMPPKKLVTEKDEVIKLIVAELKKLPTTYPTYVR